MANIQQLKKLVFKLVNDFASETGVDEEYIETEFENAWKKNESSFTPLFKGKKPSSPKKKKDPNAPKRPMSAYMLYANANRDKVRKELPDLKFTEIASELGKRWKALSEKEKKKYTELADKEKDRYKVEMESYSPSDSSSENKEEKKPREAKEKKVESKPKKTESKPKKLATVPKPKTGSSPVKTKTPYQNFCEKHEAEVVAKNPKMSKKDIKAQLSKMWKEMSKKEQAEYKTVAAVAVPKTKKKILEKEPESEDNELESEEELEEEEPEEEEPEEEEPEEEEPEEE